MPSFHLRQCLHRQHSTRFSLKHLQLQGLSSKSGRPFLRQILLAMLKMAGTLPWSLHSFVDQLLLLQKQLLQLLAHL